MSHDEKYFGFYRGVVIDNNDPKNLGRIKMIVPQVMGEQVTDWAWPVGGAISQVSYPYGTFYTTADQSIGVNTATVINTSWVEGDANKTYLDGAKIYVEETGDYFVQFSAMLIKTNSSSGTANIWFRKNGTDIPASNTKITLAGNNAEITMTVSLILDLEAGDYIQFVSSASNTNTFISSDAAGVGPATPGIIATLNLVGKYKPRPSQAVWASFEGGDPNFPLWIGAS
jgi:hypothetical protein